MFVHQPQCRHHPALRGDGHRDGRRVGVCFAVTILLHGR